MQLGQNYIKETTKLNPPLSFVPWVVVDDQPIGKVCLFFSIIIFLIQAHIINLINF